MKGLTKLVALGAVVAASASVASATPITAGQTVTADSTINANPGTILASVVGGSLNAATYTGSYNEFVYTDTTSPYASSCGSSCLTFVFTFSNNASSPNAIERASDGDGIDSFAGFETNVGYHVGAGDYGSDAPDTIDETLFGTIEFNFPATDAVAPGTGTAYLVIQTNATQFAPGFFGVIDSSTDTVAGYVPMAATPEPNSLVLLGTGLAGAAGLLFMRRRTAQGIL